MQRRPSLQPYRGHDILRGDLIEALESLAVAIRLGQPQLAVNPYGEASPRPLWKIAFVLGELERYRQADIGGLKRAAERRRRWCGRLSTLFFVLGLGAGLALYAASAFLGPTALVLALAVTPTCLWIARRFYQRLLEATFLRRELGRWSMALHDARVRRVYLPLSRAA
jgi:hypothetical protein